MRVSQGKGEGMKEEWIAYVLKQTLQGLKYFHDNGQVSDVHRYFKGTFSMSKFCFGKQTPGSTQHFTLMHIIFNIRLIDYDNTKLLILGSVLISLKSDIF